MKSAHYVSFTWRKFNGTVIKSLPRNFLCEYVFNTQVQKFIKTICSWYQMRYIALWKTISPTPNLFIFLHEERISCFVPNSTFSVNLMYSLNLKYRLLSEHKIKSVPKIGFKKQMRIYVWTKQRYDAIPVEFQSLGQQSPVGSVGAGGVQTAADLLSDEVRDLECARASQGRGTVVHQKEIGIQRSDVLESDARSFYLIYYFNKFTIKFNVIFKSKSISSLANTF